MNLLKNTLPEPKREKGIPGDAQWLAGEGAGSWFSITQAEYLYVVKRFSPSGILECAGNFKLKSYETFDISADFKFTHLSHCQQVTLIQNQKTILLELD